jgi:hypothetical protein
VVGGLIALVVVLAVASAAGFVLRQRQGRFRPVSGPAPAGAAPGSTALDGAPRSTAAARTGAVDSGRPASSDGVLSAADLGVPLGARATLVQFSTQVCAYCGPARELLTEVARERDGVAFVEIDAAERMDLTRRLHVLSTPTVLVLDALGGITSRASGPPRKTELLAVLSRGDDPPYPPAALPRGIPRGDDPPYPPAALPRGIPRGDDPPYPPAALPRGTGHGRDIGHGIAAVSDDRSGGDDLRHAR